MAGEGRTRWIDRPIRKAEDFGAPLKCPKCPPKHYFGWLWLPNLRSAPCPNCGATLVNAKTHQRTVTASTPLPPS